MNKLLLAAAMAAGLAAPAFAQTAATGAPGHTPSVEAQNAAPGGAVATGAAAWTGAAAESQLGVPGAVNSQLGARQAYQAGLGNPRDWQVSNPNNFAIPGG